MADRDIVERLREALAECAKAADLPHGNVYEGIERLRAQRDAHEEASECALRAAPVLLAELDRLRAAPPVVPLPADLIDMMTKRLKHERADLVGFTALGNEVGRAAKLDRWIAALEAAAPHPAQEGR